MRNKKGYKDMEKWRAGCHKERLKYYRQTAFAPKSDLPWTDEEIEIVLAHKSRDRDISKMLGRSVASIQIKRCRINKKRDGENIGRTKNVRKNHSPLR